MRAMTVQSTRRYLSGVCRRVFRQLRSGAVAGVALTLLLVVGAPVAHGQEAEPAGTSARAPLEALRQQTVAEAEHAFAAAALEVGVRDAFLAFLSPGAVVFTPRASNGPAYYASAPVESVLHWGPVLAETAESDDLGYTTGPFSVLATASGPVVAHGWYLSIWQRNEEGAWEVVLDMGAETAATPPAAGAVQTVRREPGPEGERAPRQATLREMDELVAVAAQRRGARRALTPMLAMDARLNDAGRIVEGGIRIARALGDAPVSYHRLGDGISEAGDFGYTYGEYTAGPLASMDEPSGTWVRIWRVGLDGQWAIVQMLRAPISP